LSITLATFEEGISFDGDIAAERISLHQKLASLHIRHIANGCRTLIVLEGWDGSGKGAIARSLAGMLDPRYFKAEHITASDAGIGERHFLWRFWQRLPAKAEITLFERSYYRRVLDERVDGLASVAEWKRGFDEINEFEAQQRDSGTHIIKLFLHISGETQRKVFAQRLHDPEARWSINAEQLHRLSTRTAYREAVEEMFSHNDTRWAPWKVLDAQDMAVTEIAVLRHIAAELEKTVPMELPDIDFETAALAARDLGLEPALSFRIVYPNNLPLFRTSGQMHNSQISKFCTA
jgi:AMP-polyphosphate phosphotransferase